MSKNKLSAINSKTYFSKNNSLISLDLSNNIIIEIDLNYFENLEQLNLNNNKIKEINLSENNKLRKLNLFKNNLTIIS